MLVATNWLYKTKACKKGGVQIGDDCHMLGELLNDYLADPDISLQSALFLQLLNILLCITQRLDLVWRILL